MAGGGVLGGTRHWPRRRPWNAGEMGRGWAMRGGGSFHGSPRRCRLAWTVMDRRGGALLIEELPWWPAAAWGSEGGGVGVSRGRQ
jgi:hypothetical protein